MRSKTRALVYKAAASFALPHAFSLSALLFAVCFFLFAFSPTAAQQIAWQPTNGPYGGTVNAFAITTSGDIFVGIPGGGVFHSTDNGNSWTEVNNGLTNLSVLSLAINSRGHIFVGTLGDGVFRSTNNGDSWTAVNAGLTKTVILALAINASGDIFAGTGGVFRSTNNGDSWTPVNTGLTNATVFALAINSRGFIFAGTSGGVFRSTNNGDSWTAVNTGLTNTSVNALAINNSSEHIFAGTDGGGVFRSTNNGDNWTPVNNGLTSGLVSALAINASGHIFAGTHGGGVFRSTNNSDSWANIGVTKTHVFALAINSSGHIFVGTNGSGVFRSTDNGVNWTPVNVGLTNLFVWSLTINDSSGHIFTGTQGGGVFRSTDNGVSWTPVNVGLTNLYVWSLWSLTINSSGHIFAGTAGGVFRSTNNGDSWTPVNVGLTNTAVRAYAINSSGHIFTGTQGGGVIRSTDNGVSWTPVNVGLTNLGVWSLTINSSGHIFAGTQVGVFRSTNNGDGWMPVNTGLTNTVVYALAINASGHIFAGTFDGVFRSRNNGDSWTVVNTGLTDPFVFAFAINSSGHIFAGILGGLGGVYRTVESTELVVSVPDFAAPPHAEVTRSISVNDASEIAGPEFDLSFNTNLLWVKNVTTTSLTEGFALIRDTTGGVLKIKLARATPIASGSGPLVNVTFKVNPTANFGDSTIIKFAKANLFDGNGRTILSLNDSAVFRVIKPAQRGDVNANGKVDVPDAILCLRIVVGLPLQTYPEGHITPTPYEFYTADCNGNGAVGVDDALCILQKSLGGAAMSKPLAVNGSCNVTLAFSKTTVQAGEVIEAAMMAACDTMPAGAEMTLSHDPNAFNVVEIVPAQPGTFLTWNPQGPGKIKAALLNLNGILAPDGKMMTIKLKANRSGEFAAPLTLEAIKLFDKNGDPLTGVEEIATLPTSISLAQNYPNPFNPETSIAYQLPKDAHVSLQIYNLTGQVIATLVNGKKPVGHHNALWNGRDEAGRQLPSGVYFYRLLVNNGEWTQVKKMTLLK